MYFKNDEIYIIEQQKIARCYYHYFKAIWKNYLHYYINSFIPTFQKIITKKQKKYCKDSTRSKTKFIINKNINLKKLLKKIFFSEKYLDGYRYSSTKKYKKIKQYF